MKDIDKLLEKYGAEIDPDKKEAFNKEFHSNYKTVAETEKLSQKVSSLQDEKKDLQKKYEEDVEARDKNLEQLKTQLKEAGVDGKKVEKLEKQISKMQEESSNAKTEYENKLKQQQVDFAVKDAVNGLKFSSKAAKKLFIQELKADEDLEIAKDGTVLNLDKFVSAYKDKDAEAFLQDKQEDGEDEGADDNAEDDNKPRFGGKTSGKLDNPKPESSPEVPEIW